ncbi:alkaline phosphatase [soil metagenome]
MSGQTRRDFLKTGALSTLVLGSGLLRSSVGPAKRSEGDAKNVIFLVTDGMSTGTLAIADLVKQSQFGSKTNWINLYESPDRDFHRGLMDMASLDSIVTGSASAASSWGCGHRVNNGTINMGPGGESHRTILEIFRDAGKSTGLVTTTTVTHGTPAGFAANVPNRDMEEEIAEQYCDRGFDLLMGGGNKFFDSAMRSDGQDLYQKMRNNGYTVVRNKEQMKRVAGYSKLLGVFDDSYLPYTVDYKSNLELQELVPTLAEMTKTALKRLEKNDDGFIIQIEGGRVDHAAHINDVAGMIYDQIAFDDAVKVVMDYTANRDDTLVILTTDHGNGNPGLTGHGSGYRESQKMMETLYNYRHSFEWIYSKFDYHRRQESIKKNVTVEELREVIEFATDTGMTNEEAKMIHEAFRGEFRAPYSKRQGGGAVLSGVLANYNGIYFMSTSHTADYVELAAWGPGSEQLPPFVKNTALFDLMVDMAGVRAYAG